MNRYHLYILHLYTDRTHQDLFVSAYGGNRSEVIALERIRDWEKDLGIFVEFNSAVTRDLVITITLKP